jgi:hypothetical protein
MAFSPFIEQTILKLLFGGTSYTPASQYSIGLSFTDPISVGITEPTGGGYARVTINNTSGNWNAPVVDSVNGGYKITNAATITFNQATANWVNGNYTSLAYFFIVDNQATPQLIVAGQLSTPKVVYAGDTPSFAPGQLSITLN